MPSSLSALPTVRPAQPQDYPAILRLYQQHLGRLVENYPDQYRPEGATIALKQQSFLDTLKDQQWTFLVAEVTGETVGVIQLSIDQDEDNEYRFPSRYVWIEELIVAPEQPLAEAIRTLVQVAESWAEQKGVHNLDCIVYHFNQPYTEILATLGYQTVSTRVRKVLS